MRRFIAYSTLAATMLVAIGVSATPVFTSISPGQEFSSGHEITFNINAKEGELPENAAEKVADEMRNRLDNFNFEEYSVKVNNGYDKEGSGKYNVQSVTVQLSCEEDIFNYVCNYLTFSGTKFSLSSNGSDETSFIEDVIDYEAVYTKQYNDLVPIVVIPLTEEGKGKVETLIESINNSSSGTTKAAPKKVNAEGEEEAQQSGPDIFLWGNYEAGDNYESAQKDPLIASKIILSFSSSEIWYTEQFGEDEDELNTKLMLICGSASEETQSYDFGKLKNANTMATYYYNMLTASAYDYEITCPTRNVTTSGIDYFSNSVETNPSYEALLSYSNDVNLTGSVTLITILVASVVIAALLAVLFRLPAIAIVANTASSIYLTYLALIGMGGLFNVPALIGGLIVLIGSLLPEIYHVVKLAEEVYKGRTLKKANQEASKKTNLITIDVAVITAFAGLMCYLIGGAAIKPLGVVLFFGAIISMLMNFIVFKLLMRLLAGTSGLQNSWKAFNINESKIPNLMLEQKASYVAPFEKINFTKTNKIGSIITGALTVLSLFGILFFGIKDGSPLNVEKATENTTLVCVQIDTTDSILNSVDNFVSYGLKDIVNKEVVKGEVVYTFIDESKDSTYASVQMNTVSNYDAETTILNKAYYFTVKVSKSLSNNDLVAVKDKISQNIEADEVAVTNDKYAISIFTAHETTYTPNQGLVALATGVFILGAALYMMFRFKPCRGLAVCASTLVTSTICYGLIALVRIGTSSVTALAMPVVAMVSLLTSLIYLVTEKAMLKENKDNLTDETRKDITVKALGKAALPSAILFGVAIFVSIFYFGFGLAKTTFLFVSMLIGELVGAYVLFVLVGPAANRIQKGLKKIHLPKFKWLAKKENQSFQPTKKNSSEPEETVFIGIND